MAQYRVHLQRHFKDGRLYEIGEIVEYEKPIPNIKEWKYLIPVDEPPKKVEAVPVK